MKKKEDLIKEMQRAYLKEWRAKNKDRVKTYNKKYWDNKAEKILSQEQVKVVD